MAGVAAPRIRRRWIRIGRHARPDKQKWPSRAADAFRAYPADASRYSIRILGGDSFLQEAYAYYPLEELIDISKQFTRSGDVWRSAAVQAAGIYKGRIGTQSDFNVMRDLLYAAADIEKQAFQALSKIKWPA